MSDKKDNIGKFFKEVLDEFEQDLPERVWDNVSRELINDKRRRKRILFWSIAASVALIIAFGAGYFIASLKSEQKYLADSYDIPDRELLLKSRDLNERNKNYKHIIKNQPENTLLSTEAFENISVALTNNDTQWVQDSVILVQDTTIFYNPESVTVTNFDKELADSASMSSPIIDITQKPDRNAEKQYELPIYIPDIDKYNPMEKKEDVEKTSGKWSLAQHNSPVYYLGSAQKMDFSPQTSNGFANTPTNQNTQEVNEKKVLLLYATGISSRYQFSPKWGIRAGLFYAVGELYSGLQRQQFEIPLTATYNLINKKICWEINPGLGTNILIFKNSRSINYSILLGTSVGYKISKRTSINIEPAVKYNFSYPGANFSKRYPLSVAIYTGLSYNL